ncbi:hypothetical protein LEP1GSC071_0204 [Leptospira santarosai str. JET]|nr:hypothetical protein LEP1GSC071_0204 [Leptospira santarosai str. JET]
MRRITESFIKNRFFYQGMAFIFCKTLRVSEQSFVEIQTTFSKNLDYKLTWILEYYDSKQIIVLNPQTLNLIERKDRDSDNVPFLKSAVVEVMEKV